MEHQNKQNESIEQGMNLAASLPDIMPDQASEKIRPIYEDIQQTLRVPFVNLIFRTLANYPDYFVQIWQQLSPAFRTRAFEQLADDVRAKGLPEQEQNRSKMDWNEQREMDRIRAFNDTIFYVLPKLLIITTAFHETSFGEITEGNQTESASTEIPQGVAEGTIKVQMVDPKKATGKVKDLFESIKERHGHPLVSSYYRALGNWPQFLEKVWSNVSPVVGTSAYEDQKQTIIDCARSGLRNLSLPKLQDVALNKEQQTEVQSILAAFRLKFIPEMLIDVALIKAMLDGTAAARSSRFSVANN